MKSEPEIYSALSDIFRDVFMRDDLELRPDLTSKDVPGWDSFKQIEIIIAVEERYKFKFHTKELDNLRNVDDLVCVIVNKRVI